MVSPSIPLAPRYHKSKFLGRTDLMNAIIEGKVMSIISNSQVAINKGSRDGVEVGMIFGIKLILPDMIDPDDSTNVVKGLFFEKGEAEISRVLDSISFANLIGKKRISDFPDLLQMTTIAYPPVDENAIIKTGDWIIRVGDLVVLKKWTSNKKQQENNTKK